MSLLGLYQWCHSAWAVPSDVTLLRLYLMTAYCLGCTLWHANQCIIHLPLSAILLPPSPSSWQCVSVSGWLTGGKRYRPWRYCKCLSLTQKQLCCGYNTQVSACPRLKGGDTHLYTQHTAQCGRKKSQNAFSLILLLVLSNDAWIWRLLL